MPSVNSPIIISAYPSETDGIYTFSFEVQWDESVQNPSLELDYEIQIDNQMNFASPNLKSYSSDSAHAGLISYPLGNLFKSFEIEMPRRLNNISQVWYWRIRIRKNIFISDWSEIGILNIYPDTSRVISQGLSNDLADETSYSKSQYSSNIDILFRMFSKEYDKLNLENLQTRNDNFQYKARDSAFSNNFGKLIGLSKSSDETYSEYRGKVLKIYKAFIQYGGLEQGIRECVKSFTGIDPLIYDYSTTDGWTLGENYLYDPEHTDLIPIIRLFSRSEKGFTWVLTIYNHWDLTFDSFILEDIVKEIMPKHTKVIFSYPTNKNIAKTFNNVYDWNSCTLSNIDTATYLNYVILSGGNVGTILTPVIDATSDINAFSYFEYSDEQYGQSIVYELRSSLDSLTWSSWETLSNNRIPVSTPIQRYLQLRVTITSSDWTTYAPIVKSIKQKYIRG